MGRQNYGSEDYMFKWYIPIASLLFATLLTIGMGIPPYANAAELTPKEAATKLGESVVAIVQGSDTICSASKIGSHQYLTAGHCVDSEFHIYTQNKKSLYFKSVIETLQKKDAKRNEDWAILNTVEDDDAVKPLTLACKEEIYLGQGVAYAGYPDPTQYAFGTGHVVTIKPTTHTPNNMDIGMDVAAAPGASGSAVISMDTGEVVGILTEGIPGERVGFWLVGFESIKNLDLCDSVKEFTSPEATDAAEK